MSSRHPLVVKLKSGEYDGKDIMEAWLLIESQAAEIEQYRKWLLKELRRQQWGSDAIDEMLHEAGLPMLSEAEERQTTKDSEPKCPHGNDWRTCTGCHFDAMY